MQYFIVILLILAPVISHANLSNPVLEKNLSKYKNVYKFFQNADFNTHIVGPAEKSNQWWCPAKTYLDPPQKVFEDFMSAAASDKLTAMRWLNLFAKILHAKKLAFCTSGDKLNAAIEKAGIILGLGLPLNQLAVQSWTPINDPQNPSHTMRLNLIYRKEYTHRFRKEILPVDLRMGFGRKVQYQQNNKNHDGYWSSMIFFISGETFGFKNIEGVGARKQGFLGFIQKLFFFLPDQVKGLYVENNVLVAKSLITMRIKDFETTEKYQMRFGN